MFAVVVMGGQQYKVKEGDAVKVEKIDGDSGNAVRFDKILLIGTESGNKVGTPYVEGASVEGEILAQARHRKVLVFKYKRRKGYEKMHGHRQHFTKIRITKING
jgi:large subunit ribosomal protein L21